VRTQVHSEPGVGYSNAFEELTVAVVDALE
jgi:hypothetical protein